MVVGANLKGVDMEGSQMTGINLRVATLKNAKLKNCNLRGATLAGTDLEVRARGAAQTRLAASANPVMHSTVVCFFPELWPLRMWPSGSQPEGLQCEGGHFWGDADSSAHVPECAVKKNKKKTIRSFLANAYSLSVLSRTAVKPWLAPLLLWLVHNWGLIMDQFCSRLGGVFQFLPFSACLQLQCERTNKQQWNLDSNLLRSEHLVNSLFL